VTHSETDWSSFRDVRSRNRAMTTGSIQYLEEKNMLWMPEHRPPAGDDTATAFSALQERHQPGKHCSPPAATQPPNRVLPFLSGNKLLSNQPSSSEPPIDADAASHSNAAVDTTEGEGMSKYFAEN